MDQRSIKRPRTESKGLEKPLKKKQKKGKKNDKGKKTGSSSSRHQQDDSSSGTARTTATKEGATMGQVLSTFHRLEQSRFEAFRRSTFSSNSVSRYIAHCLQTHQERAYARTEKTRQLTSARSLGVTDPTYTRALQQSFPTHSTNNGHRRASLEEMVTPGQAEEITAVVSTCAKAYAQRLVTAARRVASYAEGVSEEEALTPHHVLQAYKSRVRAGVDPGFFFNSSGERSSRSCGGDVLSTTYLHDTVSAAALGTVNRNELQRNAALAAQEEYDKHMEEKKQQQENQNGSSEAMQVDEEQDGAKGDGEKT